MESFAGRTVAGDLGVDVRAAGLGAFVLFHNEHPRAFGDHKTIAVEVEGTGRAFRFMVPAFRHDPHQREGLHNAEGQGSIHAAHQHGRVGSEPDLPGRVGYGVGRGRAAGSDHMTQAAKAKAHAHLARHGAHGAAGDGEQAYLFDLARVVKMVLELGKLLRASARSQNYADLTLLVEGELCRIDAGVGERFRRGCDRQWHTARNMLTFPCFYPVQLVEVLNLAGNLDGKLGSIKAGDEFYAAAALHNGAAKSCFSDSIRADHTHPRNDGPFQHKCVSIPYKMMEYSIVLVCIPCVLGFIFPFPFAAPSALTATLRLACFPPRRWGVMLTGSLPTSTLAGTLPVTMGLICLIRWTPSTSAAEPPVFYNPEN